MDVFKSDKPRPNKKMNMKISFDSKGRKIWEVSESNYSHLPDQIEKVSANAVKKIPKITEKSFFKPIDSTDKVDIENLKNKALNQALNKNLKPEENEFGFRCELCNITLKDSASYLDHKNGKKHSRESGNTMKVEKATVDSVKMKLLQLKRKPDKPVQKLYEDLEEMERIEEEEELAKKAKKPKP